MSALVHIYGGPRFESSAERDDDAIVLWLRDRKRDISVSVTLTNSEAAQLMQVLATEMGLIEAPKVAA